MALDFYWFTPEGVASSQTTAYTQANKNVNAGRMDDYNQMLENMRLNAQATGVGSEYADYIGGKWVPVAAPAKPVLFDEDYATLYPKIYHQNSQYPGTADAYASGPNGEWGMPSAWNYTSTAPRQVLSVNPTTGIPNVGVPSAAGGGGSTARTSNRGTGGSNGLPANMGVGAGSGTGGGVGVTPAIGKTPAPGYTGPAPTPNTGTGGGGLGSGGGMGSPIGGGIGSGGGNNWWNQTPGSGTGGGGGSTYTPPNFQNTGLGVGTNLYTPPTFGQPGGIGQVPIAPQGGFPFPWQPPGQQNTQYPGNGQQSVQNWTPPWANMGGGAPIQGGGGYATGDNFLADQTNDVGYLRGITEGAGYATNVTPAWQAMVDAQKQNQQRQAAELAEKFNVMGGRFSTAYGDAMGQFHNQAALDQNAMLGQMTMQAQESARQRELAAAGQLGAFASQGAQQLSTQDFGGRQAMMEAALRSAITAGGGSDQAAALMAQLGASGASQLLGNSMQGAQALHGWENQAGLNMANNSNQAAMGMFGAQQQMMQQMMNYDMGLRQQGNSAATDLSKLWQQNLMTGSQLGMQEFGIDDYNLNRVYEEWLRTQPIYNPLIPYLYSAATAQPAMYAPGFKPSGFSQVAGAIGGLMQGAGAMGMGF